MISHLRDNLDHAAEPPIDEAVARTSRVPLELEVQPVVERVHQKVCYLRVDFSRGNLIQDSDLRVRTGRCIRGTVHLRGLDGITNGQNVLEIAHAAHVRHEWFAGHLRHIVLDGDRAVETDEKPEVRRLHECVVPLLELSRGVPDRILACGLGCCRARNGHDDRVDDDANRRLWLSVVRQPRHLCVDVEGLRELEVVRVLLAGAPTTSCSWTLHGGERAGDVREMRDRDPVRLASPQDAFGLFWGPNLTLETRLEVGFRDDTVRNKPRHRLENP